MSRKMMMLVAGLLVTGLAAQAITLAADQTWDPDGNGTSDGGAGTWNTTSNYWITASPWINGNNAIFGDSGGNYTVSVADGGVTVGDLTYSGTSKLQFKSVTDNLGSITVKSGGATWNTGGGEIEFLNNGSADIALNVGSGDTLTVAGGGQFDTGVNPGGATWSAAGATLDLTSATTLRGDTETVGQFGTVKLAGGSKFFHQRNVDRTYANNWELGTGTVTFDNASARNYTLSGVISGDGELKAQYTGGKELILTGNNTFTGGLDVSTGARVKVFEAGDLGDVANDITLSGGGILKAEGVNFGSSRDIILSGTGGSIINAGVNSFGGNITGDGDLQIGNDAYSGNVNVINLSGTADYTGDTKIRVGEVILGADEAMGSGVLTLGGANTARLRLNGQTQTIGGLLNTGSKTKQIVNLNAATTGSTRGTLILDVADGASYSAGSATGINAADDRGNFNIIKDGLGQQTLANLQIGGDLSVNNGLMIINDANANAAGATSVAGGTLQINDSLTSASYATSAGGTLQIGNAGTTGNIGNADIANDGEVEFNRTDAVTYSGVISGGGQVRLDSGVALTLGAAQTYEGQTILTKGIITATAANQLSADSVLNIGGGSGGTSAVDLGGYNQTIGGLTISGWNAREVQNNGGSTAELTVNVATGESYTYGANVTGTGTIDLVKTGAGTQTIGRNGGYSTALGNLTVNGGELVWNNNDASTLSGTVSVGASGTLSGSGVLGGAVTVAGALNPGNSPGTLTFDDALTLESTATTTLELTGTGAGLYDILLNDGGDTLTAGGILAFDTTGYTAVLDDEFTVFDSWGSFSGGFSSITGTDLGGGLSLDTTDLLSTGVVTVIPEPVTLGLVAIMGGSLLGIRRIFMM